MRTFEGTMLIKKFKNDSGNKTPLTIDCKDTEELKQEIKRIKKAFYLDKVYKVIIDLRERK